MSSSRLLRKRFVSSSLAKFRPTWHVCNTHSDRDEFQWTRHISHVPKQAHFPMVPNQTTAHGRCVIADICRPPHTSWSAAGWAAVPTGRRVYSTNKDVQTTGRDWELRFWVTFFFWLENLELWASFSFDQAIFYLRQLLQIWSSWSSSTLIEYWQKNEEHFVNI